MRRRSLIDLGDRLLIPLGGRDGLVGRAIIDPENRAIAETRNWCLTRSGYVFGRGSEGVAYLHRLIEPRGEIADHINGDKLDCRRKNLRPSDYKGNARNTGCTRGRALPKGVGLTQSGRFRARIMVDWQEICLGRFDTAQQASCAYQAAAAEHFGEYARKVYADTAGVDVWIEELT